jgi:hypothetical protein
MTRTIPPLEVDVNDGNWHGHNGGPMPEGLHNDSIVDLRWAHAAHGNDCVTARGWHWSKVCAYRVTTAHVEPTKPREFWVNVQYHLARTAPPNSAVAIGWVHVREVLGDD